jgi:integrase
VILEHIRRDHGSKRLRTLQRVHVAAIVGQKPPFAARNWLKVMRGLMAFAVNAGLRPDDPTQGVRLPRAKAGEIHTWDESEIAQFEAAHPVGSKARLAMALLLYSGQRRGDVVRMGRQHIRDGVLSIRQEKTDNLVEIPVHPALATFIAQTPIAGQLTFLVSVAKGGELHDLLVRFPCADAAVMGPDGDSPPFPLLLSGLAMCIATVIALLGATVLTVAAAAQMIHGLEVSR